MQQQVRSVYNVQMKELSLLYAELNKQQSKLEQLSYELSRHKDYGQTLLAEKQLLEHSLREIERAQKHQDEDLIIKCNWSLSLLIG